jgi:threonyl-tRNA synthetase
MNNFSVVSDVEKHSAAHILALAISRIFPHAKIGIGPVTKTGFYYDFDISGEVTEADLKRIQDETDIIREQNLPFLQMIVQREDAVNMMLQRGQIYKAELINTIPDADISFFKTGEEFIDLCRGPHVSFTNQVGPIKVTKVESAHWNEDISRPQMKRISGILFRSKEELEKYEEIEKEKENRNYKEYSRREGLGFFGENQFNLTDKGGKIYKSIVNQIYNSISSKNTTDIQIFGTVENMEEVSNIVNKLTFAKVPSYREFPLEMITQIHYQDSQVKDETIPSEIIYFKKFCKQNELIFNINIVEDFITAFNEQKNEFYVNMMFHDLEDPTFNLFSSTLQKNLISHNKVLSAELDSVLMSIMIKDELGREWNFANLKVNVNEKEIGQVPNIDQISSIELNCNPLNIFAFYIENFATKLPRPFAPFKVVIIPINKTFEEYAIEVQNQLKELNINSQIYRSNLSLKRRIYKAEKKNTPFIFIVGAKEAMNQGVALRTKHTDIGLIMMKDINEYIKANI